MTFCSVYFALFLLLLEDQLPVVGLALVYALQITGLLQWTVRTFIETENNDSSGKTEHYRSGIPKEQLNGFGERDGGADKRCSECPKTGGMEDWS